MRREREISNRVEEQVAPQNQLLRMAAGVVLLVFGVGVAVWILTSLIALLGAQSPPALVDAVTPGSGGPIVLKFSEGDFSIPADVFKSVGYLIVCLIYAIASGIVLAMINGGATLLQSDSNKTLKQLVKLLERE